MNTRTPSNESSVENSLTDIGMINRPSLGRAGGIITH